MDKSEKELYSDLHNVFINMRAAFGQYECWATRVSEPGYELTGFDKMIMEKLLREHDA